MAYSGSGHARQMPMRPDKEYLPGEPIGVGDPEGGYPHKLGAKVPEAIGQVGMLGDTHIGTDVAAVVVSLRRTGMMPEPKKDQAVDFEVIGEDGTPVPGDEVDAYLRQVSLAGGVAIFKFAGFPDSGPKPGPEVDPSKIL